MTIILHSVVDARFPVAAANWPNRHLGKRASAQGVPRDRRAISPRKTNKREVRLEERKRTEGMCCLICHPDKTFASPFCKQLATYKAYRVLRKQEIKTRQTAHQGHTQIHQSQYTDILGEFRVPPWCDQVDMHVSRQRVRNNSQQGDDGAVATLSEWIYHDAFFSHLWPLTSVDDTDISPAERETDN